MHLTTRWHEYREHPAFRSFFEGNPALMGSAEALFSCLTAEAQEHTFDYRMRSGLRVLSQSTLGRSQRLSSQTASPNVHDQHAQ